MISFHNVTARLGGRAVLKDCSFTVAPEECVCITGPSGCGKTTAFELLIAASFPTVGKISVDGIPLTSMPPEALQIYRSSLGVVFQTNKFLSAATVMENLCLHQEFQGKEKPATELEAKNLLERLHLFEARNALPEWLSPGQQKLLCIGRAFMGSPLILIADEPLGSLDMEQSSLVLEMFREAQMQKKTVILLTAHPEQCSLLHPRVIDLLQTSVTPLRSQQYASPTQDIGKVKTHAHESSSSPSARVKITALGM